MRPPTEDERRTAIDAAEEDLDDIGEIVCVLDALANEENPQDCLAEYRYWRSPAGRRQEAVDAFDSGRI